MEYDEARITHHAELVVVATSTVRQVAHQGRLLSCSTGGRSAPAAA